MTGNMRAPLRSVAVVGGGIVALAAAIGFSRAVPGGRVSLVPAPVPEDALADRLPLALPSAQGALARIGLDPDRLVAHGIARRRQASRFADWSTDGSAWLVDDDAAVPTGPVPPHQLWLRASTGMRTLPPFHRLFPTCVGVLAGMIDAGADTGLHLDAQATGGALASLARQSAIDVRAPLRAVRHAGDRVDSIQLDDGTRLTADLFVDATGSARRLLTTAQAAAFEPWHDALPCDRMALARDDDAPALAIDAYRATATGWQAQLRGLTMHGFTAARPPRDPAPAIALAPGRLSHPFAGNVLAIGEAAVQPGPLGLAGFTLALLHLDLALELLPCRGEEPLLRAEYDRRAGLRADRLRDFLGAHYRAGGPRCGAFWADLAHRPCPPSLANILAQFTQRGLLVTGDEDSVGRDTWLAMLLGQGLRPRRPDPIAASLSPDAAADAVIAAASRIAARFSDRTATRS